MEQKFKLGQLVCLKSNKKHSMTVGMNDDIIPNSVICNWLTTDGLAQSGRYHEDMLEEFVEPYTGPLPIG